ncbi:hypothetical protein L484_000053 [Morus notabilis]|uniref:Uncharacterized protein n=1 Tax=Morus notabilis TaxID=981085 RepID=W9SBA3_9ROSA|nr:hypothetical protein L484_000053 [Morus notabilis]
MGPVTTPKFVALPGVVVEYEESFDMTDDGPLVDCEESFNLTANEARYDTKNCHGFVAVVEGEENFDLTDCGPRYDTKSFHRSGAIHRMR